MDTQSSYPVQIHPALGAVDISYGNIENDPALCLQVENLIYSRLVGGNATFDLPDSSDSSVEGAKAIMNLFLNDFNAFDLPSGVKGEFKFKMTRKSDGKVITGKCKK